MSDFSGLFDHLTPRVSDFKPTKGQQDALDAIDNLSGSLWGAGDTLVISGAAGTGKTSLLKVLAEQGKASFVLTPTGKAAQRVKQASGLHAMTLHKWAYSPREDEKTGITDFVRKHEDELEIPENGVLLVDEASMVTQDVWNDLHIFATMLGLKIALIGDGYQLPPVETDQNKRAFSVFNEEFPAAMKVNLTEVLRQALESPIIRTATDIRNGANLGDLLGPWDTGESLEALAMTTLAEQGAIIVHRNITRQDLNVKVRQLKGLRPDRVENGEPLLVMRNNYDADVFNGEVHTVGSLWELGTEICIDRYQNAHPEITFDHITTEDSEFVVAREEIFSKLPPKFYAPALGAGSRRLIRDLGYDKTPFVQANMGYVLTCHKSQGSEWDSVLAVFEPSLRLNEPASRRWAYTAITRAKKNLRVTFL